MPTKDEALKALKARGVNPLPRVEVKDWVSQPLTETRWFVHCSKVKPELVRKSYGLDPDYSRELVIDEAGNTIGDRDGRFVLCGVVDADQNPVDAAFVPVVPGFVNRHGYLGDSDKESTYPDGYIYVFRLGTAPAWRYYAKGGLLTHGSEVGFDRPIPHTAIKVWHLYNKRTQTATPYPGWPS